MKTKKRTKRKAPIGQPLKTESMRAAIIKLLGAGAFVVDYYADILLGYSAAKSLRRLRAQGIPIEKDPERVRKSIYHLNRGEFITIKSIGDKKFELALTPKGQKLFGQYNFYTLKIPPQKQWDKRWRIVAFDIPEKYKANRDIFRKRLKGMGFFQFQKSFWIYPFECEKEIHYLCEHLGIHDYTFIFTGNFLKDKLLTKYFQQKKILTKAHFKAK